MKSKRSQGVRRGLAQAAHGDVIIAINMGVGMDEVAQTINLAASDAVGGSRHVEIQGDKIVATYTKPQVMKKLSTDTENVPHTEVFSFTVFVRYECNLGDLKGRAMDEPMSNAIKITSGISNIVKRTEGTLEF